jgi:hypothetical protein
MQATDNMTNVVDEAYAIDDPAAAYARVSWGLEERGFAVQYTEPPLVSATSADFHGRLRGERDVVLDAQRRQIGKGLVLGSLAMVGVTLAVIVSGEERRWLLEWLLTIEVVVGGYGLMLLRNPPARRRSVIDVALVGGSDGVRVTAGEGVGIVEDDVIFDWVRDAPVAVTAAELESLVLDGGRSEAKA